MVDIFCMTESYSSCGKEKYFAAWIIVHLCHFLGGVGNDVKSLLLNKINLFEETLGGVCDLKTPIMVSQFDIVKEQLKIGCFIIVKLKENYSTSS